MGNNTIRRCQMHLRPMSVNPLSFGMSKLGKDVEPLTRLRKTDTNTASTITMVAISKPWLTVRRKKNIWDSSTGGYLRNSGSVFNDNQKKARTPCSLNVEWNLPIARKRVRSEHDNSDEEFLSSPSKERDVRRGNLRNGKRIRISEKTSVSIVRVYLF